MSETGFEAVDIESLHRHYDITLNHWFQHFEENSKQLRALAGCAHDFTQHWISIYQILAVKSGTSMLPLTREYLNKS